MLIFSQMVRMLNIISDYMRLRGFQHQRLDGSTPAGQRHQVSAKICSIITPHVIVWLSYFARAHMLYQDEMQDPRGQL